MSGSEITIVLLKGTIVPLSSDENFVCSLFHNDSVVGWNIAPKSRNTSVKNSHTWLTRDSVMLHNLVIEILIY